MLKKVIHIFVLSAYWLCLTPYIVLLLHNHEVIYANTFSEYFLQYTTLLFVLIVGYWLINRIVEHTYMKYEIQKRVRKITIKRQLERLERGEIDLKDAQRLSTFTKVNSPRMSRKKRSSNRKPKSKEMVEMKGKTGKKTEAPKPPAKAGPGEATTTATTPAGAVVASDADLPAYSEAVKLLENNNDNNK